MSSILEQGASSHSASLSRSARSLLQSFWSPHTRTSSHLPTRGDPPSDSPDSIQAIQCVASPAGYGVLAVVCLPSGVAVVSGQDLSIIHVFRGVGAVIWGCGLDPSVDTMLVLGQSDCGYLGVSGASQGHVASSSFYSHRGGGSAIQVEEKYTCTAVAAEFRLEGLCCTDVSLTINTRSSSRDGVVAAAERSSAALVAAADQAGSIVIASAEAKGVSWKRRDAASGSRADGGSRKKSKRGHHKQAAAAAATDRGGTILAEAMTSKLRGLRLTCDRLRAALDNNQFYLSVVWRNVFDLIVASWAPQRSLSSKAKVPGALEAIRKRLKPVFGVTGVTPLGAADPSVSNGIHCMHSTEVSALYAQ